jgi:aminoglycoside 6'-N-acetyltransferase
LHRQAEKLQGEQVVLRPLRSSDSEDILRIGAEPSVARWWPDVNAKTFRERIDGRAGTTAFAVEHEGRVIGLVEYWEEKDPEFRHAGIDLFLTTDLQGRGLGTDTVRTLVLHLVRDRGHHRITIDPEASNERAIRCYEHVGFKPVGILRRYFRGADGTWRDGLLLDLLAEEVEEAAR